MLPLETGGIVGNVNIFTGLLSVEKMQSITNGTDCGSKGDYLAWDPSQWETTKEHVRYFEIDIKHLCFYYGTKRFIRVSKRSQAEAINTCSKFGNGHLPKVESNASIDKFKEFAVMEEIYQEIVEQKGKGIGYKETNLPYLYNCEKKTFLNMYEDYEFNITSRRIQQWKIWFKGFKGLKVVQFPWYLRTPDENDGSPSTCVTYGPILFSLMGVCKSSFLWIFTKWPFYVANKNVEGNSWWNYNKNNLYYVHKYMPYYTMFYNSSSSSWELVRW